MEWSLFSSIPPSHHQNKYQCGRLNIYSMLSDLCTFNALYLPLWSCRVFGLHQSSYGVFHPLSNIFSCQPWEMCDCSWWQLASCLSRLLCINIHPSTPPSAPSLTYSLRRALFRFSFQGLPAFAAAAAAADSCLFMCECSICQPRGRLEDKFKSFLTSDAGLVWLLSCLAGHNRMERKKKSTQITQLTGVFLETCCVRV